MAYSARQWGQINTVQKSISRTNTMWDVFGGNSEQYQKQAQILIDLGAEVIDGKFKMSNKMAANLSLTPNKTAMLKGFRTSKQELSKSYRELGIEHVGVKVSEEDKQRVIQRVADKASMHEWIEQNLAAIYEYEQEQGEDIIHGHDVPTWEDLIEMRKEIEGGDYGIFKTAVDDGDYPDT